MNSYNKQRLNKGGRPLFDGKSEEVVLSKLRDAWDIGATDEEACVHADISIAALNRYCQKEPKFREEKERRKQKPILKARQTIYNDLDNVKTAKWFLERQCKSEFSTLRKELIGEDKEHHFKGLAELMKFYGEENA